MVLTHFRHRHTTNICYDSHKSASESYYPTILAIPLEWYDHVKVMIKGLQM